MQLCRHSALPLAGTEVQENCTTDTLHTDPQTSLHEAMFSPAPAPAAPSPGTATPSPLAAGPSWSEPAGGAESRARRRWGPWSGKSNQVWMESTFPCLLHATQSKAKQNKLNCDNARFVTNQAVSCINRQAKQRWQSSRKHLEWWGTNCWIFVWQLAAAVSAAV